MGSREVHPVRFFDDGPMSMGADVLDLRANYQNIPKVASQGPPPPPSAEQLIQQQSWTTPPAIPAIPGYFDVATVPGDQPIDWDAVRAIANPENREQAIVTFPQDSPQDSPQPPAAPEANTTPKPALPPTQKPTAAVKNQ